MEREQIIYHWAKRLLKVKSLEGLKDESKRPLHSPNQTPEVIEKRIERIRKRENYLGPEQISFKLKKYSINCPPSTVYRVLCRLNLIIKPYKKAKKNKHTKRYRRVFPGYLQMDIKYVPDRIEDRQYYQISVVDHCSSWRYMEILERRTEEEVIGFLNRMEEKCPFAIIQLQTDNATEFTDKFSSGFGQAPSGNHRLDRWCGLREIEHKLIPVGEKEINGKVENTHRFDEREFYQQFFFASLASLREGVRWYNRRWNKRRATKTLGWKTPEKVVEDSYLKATLFLLIYNPKYLEQKAEAYKTKHLVAGKIIYKEKKKSKRLTQYEKYMQFVKWDKNQNWALFSLDFSRNFSGLFCIL